MELWSTTFPKMATVIPEGEHGRAAVRHVRPTPTESLFSGIRSRGYVSDKETYAQLRVDGQLWMSDTRDERRDHMYFVSHSHGDVLIGGLGLGMVTLACLLRDNVATVTVLEKDLDVIALIQPHLRQHTPEGKTLTIHEADVFTWKPEKGTKYDAIWMDIWPNLCVDDLEEHAKLNRKYSRMKRDASVYCNCWGNSFLKDQRRRYR